MNGFLQEYGLNIVAVIIVLAFIVFASVFGDTITGGINDITSDFFAKSGVTADINGGGDGNGGAGGGEEDGDAVQTPEPCSHTTIGTCSDCGAIIFTISGVTYQAEAGMTWKDWIGSKYDTHNNLVIGTGGMGTGIEYVWVDKIVEGDSMGNALYYGPGYQTANHEILARDYGKGYGGRG